jgi:hypothetical protein
MSRPILAAPLRCASGCASTVLQSQKKMAAALKLPMSCPLVELEDLLFFADELQNFSGR